MILGIFHCIGRPFVIRDFYYVIFYGFSKSACIFPYKKRKKKKKKRKRKKKSAFILEILLWIYFDLDS